MSKRRMTRIDWLDLQVACQVMGEKQQRIARLSDDEADRERGDRWYDLAKMCETRAARMKQ